MKLYILRDKYGLPIGIFDYNHVNKFIMEHAYDGKMNDVQVESTELNSSGDSMSNFTAEDWDDCGLMD